jgi:hypothetical protein
VSPNEALNIIEVQGRGYMKATKEPKDTIVMVPIDPVEEHAKRKMVPLPQLPRAGVEPYGFQ